MTTTIRTSKAQELEYMNARQKQVRIIGPYISANNRSNFANIN